METVGNSQRLLRIHRDDNVLIVVAPIQSGDKELLNGTKVVFGHSIPIGHKVAAQAITAYGEKKSSELKLSSGRPTLVILRAGRGL